MFMIFRTRLKNTQIYFWLILGFKMLLDFQHLKWSTSILLSRKQFTFYYAFYLFLRKTLGVWDLEGAKEAKKCFVAFFFCLRLKNVKTYVTISPEMYKYTNTQIKNFF